MSRTPDEREALLGSTLRRLRKERKLELAEVAARVGISSLELTRLERGNHRVSLETLVRLLSALGADQQLVTSIASPHQRPAKPETTGPAGDAEPDEAAATPSHRARASRLGEPLALV